MSLCSGIEAATVAWQPLGWEPVAFAEIDPFPSAVLTHHYPDVPNFGDINLVFDWRIYRGTVDLLVAGTPCQDFSIAGKRTGFAGERSALALAFVQVLSIVDPRWFVWENVPGVFSTNGGRDFGTFLRALDDIGYSCAWRVLDAQYFGVPQRRRRVYIVGHSGDWRPATAVLFEPDSLRRNTQKSRKKRTHVTQSLTGRPGGGGPDDNNKAQGGFYVPDIVSQAMSCKWAKGTSGPAGDEHHNLVCAPITTKPYADNEAQGSKLVLSVRTAQTSANGCGIAEECAHTIDGANGQAVLAFHGSPPLGRNQDRECCIIHPAVRRLTPRECERLMGFPDDYTDIIFRGKPAADGHRYRALGNSMAVPVMQWIGRRISQVEAGI